MNYCEKCHILSDDDPCPRCGYKYVRPPKEDDYVFLVEKKFLEAEMLEGALKDEGVRVVTDETVTGVWRSKIIDSLHSRHRIFVPYGDLERSEKTMSDMFSEEAIFEWEEEEI